MNNNLLTKERASEIIELSKAECLLTGSRVGCTITKHMTLKQQSNILHPDRDFFYEKNDEEAVRLFMKYCVQQDEIIGIRVQYY